MLSYVTIDKVLRDLAKDDEVDQILSPDECIYARRRVYRQLIATMLLSSIRLSPQIWSRIGSDFNMLVEFTTYQNDFYELLCSESDTCKS